MRQQALLSLMRPCLVPLSVYPAMARVGTINGGFGFSVTVLHARPEQLLQVAVDGNMCAPTLARRLDFPNVMGHDYQVIVTVDLIDGKGETRLFEDTIILVKTPRWPLDNKKVLEKLHASWRTLLGKGQVRGPDPRAASFLCTLVPLFPHLRRVLHCAPSSLSAHVLTPVSWPCPLHVACAAPGA